MRRKSYVRTTRLSKPSSGLPAAARIVPLASRRANAGWRASMPVSRTAHRMPDVLASNSRPAASAFTVSRERQMLVLARRFRLMLHTTPAAAPSGRTRPSYSSAKTPISASVSVGRSTGPSSIGRPRPSASIQLASRISFTRSLDSTPGMCGRPWGPASFSREASATRLSRVHSLPTGATARRHQSVSGSAPRRSSQKESVARTTDSLNSTRGAASPGWVACHRSPAAVRSCSRRTRRADAAVAASDSLCGVKSSSMRCDGVPPYAIQTSGRIGKSCVNRRWCSGRP